MKLFIIPALLLGINTYAADCTVTGQYIDINNYRQVLLQKANDVAKVYNSPVEQADFVGFDGAVITSGVSKSAASVIASLKNGLKINYTILVEDNCTIGGFG